MIVVMASCVVRCLKVTAVCKYTSDWWVYFLFYYVCLLDVHACVLFCVCLLMMTSDHLSLYTLCWCSPKRSLSEASSVIINDLFNEYCVCAPAWKKGMLHMRAVPLAGTQAMLWWYRCLCIYDHVPWINLVWRNEVYISAGDRMLDLLLLESSFWWVHFFQHGFVGELVAGDSEILERKYSDLPN